MKEGKRSWEGRGEEGDRCEERERERERVTYRDRLKETSGGSKRSRFPRSLYHRQEKEIFQHSAVRLLGL